MLRISRSRGIPRALSFAAIVLFAVAASGEALGKTRAKKRAVDLDAPIASTLPSAPLAPPVRFFTINDVLAKHDGRKAAGNTKFAALTDGGVASDAAEPQKISPQVSDEPFGLFTFRAPEGLLWVKWRGVEQSMRSEAAAIERCKADSEDCSIAARRFVGIADAARVSDPYARVKSVNRSVNQAIRYVSDFEQHGVADRWTSPLATLASGRGDCEDYAILKYVALRDAGVATEDLKLVLVRDMAVRQDHAVLMVRVDRRWLVLDNRSAMLFETADVRHFMPLFAIDERGVNLFAAPYAARPMHESESDLMPAAALEMGGGTISEAPILL